MMFLTYLTVVVVVVIHCLLMTHVVGIRFVIDRGECLSHVVDHQGNIVHVSFVVIKAESPWHFSEDGVDFEIKGPSGERIYNVNDSASGKYEFMAHKKGLYHFCFTNKSPYHETIDFDVQVSHFASYNQHAKDEHFKPLFDQIAKLEEALYNIQFEQHWLQAENDRQAVVNEKMCTRAAYKALIESAALIGVSILQVYLLQRLFERKLRRSRV